MSTPVPHNGHEHELEPEFGLPEPLPKTERILWQGTPDWRSLAVRVFHLRKLALYFAAIFALRAWFLLSEGSSVGAVALDLLKLSPIPLFALASLAGVAWLTGRTTVYTITDRRVVLRIGIVLTLTFNLPLPTLRNADLHGNTDGAGDIALRIPESDRIAYLHLWPHARPWHVKHPQPMLRSVPDAPAVAQLLATAWAEATGVGPVAATRRQPAMPAAPRAHEEPQHGAVPAH